MQIRIEEVVALAKQGYDCQPIGENKWLMRRKDLTF